MNDIIEKLVAKFGVDKTVKGLEVLGLIQSTSVKRGPVPPPKCDTGYYWNETLQKCILDIG